MKDQLEQAKLAIVRAWAEMSESERQRLGIDLTTTATQVVARLIAVRALRKIGRRLGVELTYRDAVGLLVAARSVAIYVDPNFRERARTVLLRTQEERHRELLDRKARASMARKR